MSDAALIGVDWGTSDFRGFSSTLTAKFSTAAPGPHGIMTVKDGGLFRRALR